MNERLMNRVTLLALQSGIVLSAGALLVVASVLVTATLPAIRFLFEAHTMGPFTEELLKYAVCCLLLQQLKIRAAALPLLGVSFGLMEAYRHLQVYGSIGLGALAAHCVLGLIMTLLLFCALRAQSASRRIIFFSLALCVPALLHLIYNTSIVPYLH